MMKALTRICIKLRWVIILLWLVVTAFVFFSAPKLSDVMKSDQASFLPSSSETTQASEMIKKLFPDKGGRSSIVLLIKRTGGITEQDKTYAKGITDFIEVNKTEYHLREIVSPYRKESLEKYMISKNNEVALIYFNLTSIPYTDEATEVVSKLVELPKEKFKGPTGLEVYWTGDAAISYEEHESVNKSMEVTVKVTIFMVLGILLLIYRSPVAALIPMVAIGISYTISKGIVAWAAMAGLGVSTFTDTFLIAVLFGAGTDYCLLITSRYKEELSSGIDSKTALIDSMANTGIAVISSGGTVIVGFFCMIFAKFGLFNSTGPSVAIGVAVTILSVITLVPALLSVLGKGAFWPLKNTHVKTDTWVNRLWVAIADRVTTKPIRIILLTFLIILPFLLMTNYTKMSYDQIKDLPADNGSVKGFEIMKANFAQGSLMPVKIVIKSDKSFWDSRNLKTLDSVCDNLMKIGTVDQVRTASRPSGEKLTEATLKSQLEEMSDGISKMNDGIDPLKDGLGDIQTGTDKIADGLDKGSDGFKVMADALTKSASGLKKTADAISTMSDGTGSSVAGLTKVGGGLAQLSQATKDASAGITASKSGLDQAQGALNALAQSNPALATNPYFQGALQAIQGVSGSLVKISSGLNEIAAGIESSKAGTDSVATGLGKIETGMNSASSGLSKINTGLIKIRDGQSQAARDLTKAADGLAKISTGAGEAVDGVVELGDGIKKLDDGVKDNYTNSDALSEVFYLPQSTIDDNEDLRTAMKEYISADGKGVVLDVILNVEPYSVEALDSVDKIKEITGFSLVNTPLEGSEFHIGGMSVAMNEVRTLIDRDFMIVMIFVLSGIFLVLCLMLRSLIAPVYLIFTILLSYGCTMGISVVFFQFILGGEGLHWSVPFFSFCILVALGVDYNIFLMSRVKEEHILGDTKTGIARAVASTGGIITSCGIIMAGTFGAMLVSPVRPIVQIGFTAVVGLLIDTFVIRTLVVPAIAVKFGELNWWPGKKVRVMPHEDYLEE